MNASLPLRVPAVELFCSVLSANYRLGVMLQGDGGRQGKWSVKFLEEWPGSDHLEMIAWMLCGPSRTRQTQEARGEEKVEGDGMMDRADGCCVDLILCRCFSIGFSVSSVSWYSTVTFT